MIDLVAPLHELSLARPEKLEILRRLDHFRHWRSLDEKRYCLGCDKIIRGEEIRVMGNSDEPESLQLICPTEHCSSIPMDWALPPNDTIARVSRHQVEEFRVSVPVARRTRMRFSLRKLASRWLRAG